MAPVAIASGTQVAADIGAAIARDGGNAVDASIAATFATWVCEPGLTAIGSGAFSTVWAPGERPVTIDGFVEMPGRSADRARFGQATYIEMTYGGCTPTYVGAGSVATPGALAAVEATWKRWGALPWNALIEPAIDIARHGYPMPLVSQIYFAYSGEPIFTQTPGAIEFWQRPDGTLREAGETMTSPELAGALEEIASEGAAALYHGDVGRIIASWITEHGGLIGADDLAAYETRIRPCLMTQSGGWHLATNPTPAVGGLVVSELAAMMDGRPRGAWRAEDIARFARAMEFAFTDRRNLLQEADLDAAADRLLGVELRHRIGLLSAPATSHTSAVDSDGLACSVTTSTGYSSGVVVPGTGIMLNNVLGEIELFPRGLHTAEPGWRLRSNMAPSVARSDDGDIVSFGAAGADRITSAMAQVWLNLVGARMTLEEAIASSRCHLELESGKPVLAHEPGIDLSAVPFETRPFDERHMFFGGVQAAERTASGQLRAAGDLRRQGGSAVVTT